MYIHTCINDININEHMCMYIYIYKKNMDAYVKYVNK